MSLVIITHDLGVVADICDRVAVMYAGQVVETADAEELFTDPAHPYTRALLASNPIVAEAGTPLRSIPGTVPNPVDWPHGCRFADRCPLVVAACLNGPIKLELLPAPPARAEEQDHAARCIRAEELDASNRLAAKRSTKPSTKEAA